MTRIEKEYIHLKRRYLLKTCLYFDKRIVQHFGVRCQGIYFPGVDRIYLRNKRFSKEKIKVMLHEIAHAIQHKQNRLEISRRDTRRRYAQEIEAEFFSIKEYDRLYKRKLGHVNHRWTLAPYQVYRSGWISPKYKKPEIKKCKITDVAAFINTLKEEDKKPIMKVINEWTKLLKKKSSKSGT